MEYLSPQEVFLRQVYVMIASPLWLQLRGPVAWQATPPWAVCRRACHRLLPWLRVMFAMVPYAALPGSDQLPLSTAPATRPASRLSRPGASDPGGVVRCALSLCCPSWGCVCGVRGLLEPVHRCARPLCSVRGVCGHLALVYRCARCGRHVCGVRGFVGDPPLKCRSVMKSLAPRCASKCPLWALSASDVATNVRSVCTELR